MHNNLEGLVGSVVDAFKREGLDISPDDYYIETLNRVLETVMENGTEDDLNFEIDCINSVLQYISENSSRLNILTNKPLMEQLAKESKKVLKTIANKVQKDNKKVFTKDNPVSITDVCNPERVLYILTRPPFAQHYAKLFQNIEYEVAFKNGRICIESVLDSEELLKDMYKTFHFLCKLQVANAENGLLMTLPANFTVDSIGEMEIHYENLIGNRLHVTKLNRKQKLKSTIKPKEVKKSIKVADTITPEEQNLIDDRTKRYVDLVKDFKNEEYTSYKQITKQGNIRFTNTGIGLVKQNLLIDFRGILNTKTNLYVVTTKGTSYTSMMTEFVNKNLYSLSKLELNVIYGIMVTSFDRKRKINMS